MKAKPQPQPEPKKQIERHPEQMFSKSSTHKIKRVSKRNEQPIYTVTSGESGSTYTVMVNDDNTAGCNCKYATKGGNVEPWSTPVTCSHTLAVIARRAHQQQRFIKFTTNPNAYRKSKRIQMPDGVTIITPHK